MVIEAFILLMWFGNPMELKEYTVRDGLGDCLKAKRTIERTLRGGKSSEYTGSVRLGCKELKVEVSDDGLYIIRNFIDADPKELNP
jgi:hypothetical protein|tara:strand:+ start:1017 stop:1274 length:258 start_codon:yes stop_codon:yes gene_type:complete